MFFYFLFTFRPYFLIILSYVPESAFKINCQA